MHATIYHYDGVTGSIDEVVRVGRQLAIALRKSPGFVSYALLDAGDGVLVAVSIFEQKTELEAADRLVEAWVRNHLAALLPQPGQVITGEVIVQKGM